MRSSMMKKLPILMLAMFFAVSGVFILEGKADAAKKPKISKISPKTGTQGETVTVTIKGKNFNKKKKKNKVIVSSTGVKAKVKKASKKKITAKFTIDADADASKIKVYVKIGKKKSNKKNFTVKEAVAPSDISGTVTDPSSAAVASAKVVFVPAADIEGISSLQPLEDLANLASSKGYISATTGTDGKYSVTGLTTDADYFVCVLPSGSSHLPGGDVSREAFNYAGSPLTKDVEITQVQSSSATYIGSTACLVCHPKTSLKKTLHFLGLREPDVVNSLQDISAFSSKTNKTLEQFTVTGTVLYFSNGPSYTVSITNTIDADFSATLKRSGSATPYTYTVTLADVISTTGSVDYNVDVTYGGEGLWKMRFITEGTDGLYYVLPLQHNEKAEAGSYNEWVNYHGDRWYSSGLTSPAPEKSFDVNCSGCHGATGVKLTNGKFDQQFAPQTDGIDGKEWNIGCEKCHGPGSEHQAAGGNGKSIVMPENLSAGRFAMICGSCHQRGNGKGVLDGSGNTTEFASVGDLTASTDITVFRPGMTPASFYGFADGTGIAPFEVITPTTSAYYSPINFASDKHSWQDKTKGYGDTKYNHSKGHHQQYFDLTREKMFKNDRELVVCATCHDAHGSDQEHQLKYNADNNAGCLECHNGTEMNRDATKHPANFQDVTRTMVDTLQSSGTADPVIATAVEAHMTQWASMAATYDPEGTAVGRCVKCHMPKTAKSAINSATKVFGSNPYYEGDIHSHLFDIVGKDVVEASVNDGNSGTGVIPSPYTNACATCHTSTVL